MLLQNALTHSIAFQKKLHGFVLGFVKTTELHPLISLSAQVKKQGLEMNLFKVQFLNYFLRSEKKRIRKNTRSSETRHFEALFIKTSLCQLFVFYLWYFMNFLLFLLHILDKSDFLRCRPSSNFTAKLKLVILLYQKTCIRKKQNNFCNMQMEESWSFHKVVIFFLILNKVAIFCQQQSCDQAFLKEFVDQLRTISLSLSVA